MGRLAALCLACAGAALCHSQTAAAQARSPAGEKAGARGLGGAVIQFEESAGRGILYFEQRGGIVTAAPPPVERPRAEVPAPVAAAPKTAKAAPAERKTANGPGPVRTPQRQASAAELAALGR